MATTDYAMVHLYCDWRHLDCRYDEHTPEDVTDDWAEDVEPLEDLTDWDDETKHKDRSR